MKAIENRVYYDKRNNSECIFNILVTSNLIILEDCDISETRSLTNSVSRDLIDDVVVGINDTFGKVLNNDFNIMLIGTDNFAVLYDYEKEQFKPIMLH